MYLFAITAYIGQTKELKQGTRKHKSDVIYPNNCSQKKMFRSFKNLLKTERTIFQYLPGFL